MPYIIVNACEGAAARNPNRDENNVRVKFFHNLEEAQTEAQTKSRRVGMPFIVAEVNEPIYSFRKEVNYVYQPINIPLPDVDPVEDDDD